MKKKIIVVALMLCLACGSIFALGIGVQGGSDVYSYANGSVPGGTSIDITFKLSRVPFVFAVGIPSFDPLAVGVSADYWIVNPRIAGGKSENSWSLNWYIGAGIFGNLLTDDVSAFSFGGRIPIGLNIRFFKRILEGYLQVAPGIEFDVANEFSYDFVCPVNYGLRLWIN